MLRLFFSVFVALAGVRAAAVEVALSHNLVVVTKGEPGIRADGDFYPLGMTARQFIRDFGPPVQSKAGRLEYPDDGLEVRLDGEGSINSFLLDVKPQRAGAASPEFETDTGIRSTADYQRALAMQGNPEEEVSQGGHRALIYGFGVIEFRANQLSTIRVGFEPNEHEQIVDWIRKSRDWMERLKHRGDPQPVLQPPPVPAPSRAVPSEALNLFPDLKDATRVVFVIDASGSMLNRFDLVRQAMARGIGMLRPDQMFNLIVFQGDKFATFSSGTPGRATPEFKASALGFLGEKVVPRGETNPIPAFKLAFEQSPDLIYLLTDGDLPDGAAVVRAIREFNANRKTQVSAIEISSALDRRMTPFSSTLLQIAKENGGVYGYVDHGGAGLLDPHILFEPELP
jgi:hypothetical protein